MFDNKTPTNFGYYVGVLGVVLILLWLGIYKFTPTEAALIRPLVENHSAMAWLYNVFSEQAVSSIVGFSEIVVALGLLLGFFNRNIAVYSGLIACVIFITTLSFQFTTPNAWKVSDGILIPNFFLVKDLVFLAISIMVIERNK